MTGNAVFLGLSAAALAAFAYWAGFRPQWPFGAKSDAVTPGNLLQALADAEQQLQAATNRLQSLKQQAKELASQLSEAAQ